MNLRKSPYKYQVEGVEYATSHHYCVIGDEMGLGKTLQALLLWQKTGLNTVVVCPGYLRDNWEREAQESFAFPPLTYVVHDKHDAEYITKLLSGSEKIDLNLIIISYDLLDKCSTVFRWARMYIADECHYLKNIATKRTKSFHAYVQAFAPERFLGLSGTPIKNNAAEWFSLLTLCSYNPKITSGRDLRHVHRSYYSFAESFANKRERRFGGRKVITYSGVKNVEGLKELLKGKYIRRMAEGILELPEIIEREVLCTSDNQDSLLAKAWEGEISKDAISKAKKDCAIAKSSFTLSTVLEILEQGEGPVIVFSDHLDPVDFISKGLEKAGYRVAVIQGSVPSQDRAEFVAEFQAGRLDALVATIGSASTGFTLTRSRHMVFNDVPWVPSDLWQARARFYRIGQTRKCVVHYVSGSPLDSMITRTIKSKTKTLEKAL